MAVERLYSCCLCREGYRPPLFDKELFGVYWDHDKLFKRRNTINTEHHLCRNCLKSAHDMWEQMKSEALAP